MSKLTWDQVGEPVSPARFFSTPGAPAAPAVRQNGRAFFGPGWNHGQQTDGNVTGGSWLQGFSANGVNIDDWDYFEDQARVSSVSDFGVAISGVSRTYGASDAIGVVGAAVNDSTNKLTAWGGYLDAVKANANAGATIGLEIDAANLVGTSPLGGVTPYRTYAEGMVGVLQLGAGSDSAVFGDSYAVDWFINIARNGGAAWTGINFKHDAIMREGVGDTKASPGNSGYARAISLATEQGLSWYSKNAVIVAAGSFEVGKTYIIQSVGTTNFVSLGATTNTVGTPFVATAAGSGTGTASLVGSQSEAVRLYSAVSSPSVKLEQVFSDTVIAFNELTASAGALFQIGVRADAGAHVLVDPAPVGGAPVIKAAGSNANINMLAMGKGTGLFGFGQFTDTGGGNGYVRIITQNGKVIRLTGTLEV